MSAETLRQAAALMRSRAEAAAGRAPSPWLLGIEVREDGKPFAAGVVTLTDHREELSVVEGFSVVECSHIASWHPAVALAVADWLEEIAERQKPSDPRRGRTHGWTGSRLANAVAKAYLGDQS